MKIIISIITLVYLAILLSSCENNVKKEYFNTGELKSLYLDSITIHYYKNGVQNEVISVDDSLSYTKVYFENGKLDWEAHYINGELNGVFKNYSKDEKILSETFFENNKQHGLSVVYFPSGKVKTKSYFENGLMHGKFRVYRENGTLEFSEEYVNDTVVSWIKVTEDEKVVDEYRKIDIEMTDSVFVDEEVKCRIKVCGTIYDEPEISVFLSASLPNFDSSSFEDLDVKNGLAEYDFIPNKEGLVGVFVKAKISSIREVHLVAWIQVIPPMSPE